MADQQQLQLKISGLITNPNLLSEAPAGSMSVIDNCVIRRPSIVENRRGQQQYGTQLSGIPDGLFNYRTSLLTHVAPSSLYYDSDGAGTWTQYTGAFFPPSEGTKNRSVQANNNFYITTSNGIYYTDELTDNPIKAGAPRGLGGTGSTTGTDGFMQPNTNVAYRLVWGYTDKNNNLKLGVPSDRVVVGNSVATVTGSITSGSAVITAITPDTSEFSVGMIVTDLSGLLIPANTTIVSLTTNTITLSQLSLGTLTSATIQGGFSANVEIAFNIPHDITDGAGTSPAYFYQLYRSQQTLTLGIIPNDELQQVYQGNVNATDLANKYITILDETPDDLRGTLIYTAPSLGGIANANFQPPLAEDMCLYYNQIILANTTQLYTQDLTLVGTGTTSFTYTPVTGTINNTTSITGLSSTTNLRVGQRITGTGIPANSTIVSIDTIHNSMVISHTTTGGLYTGTFTGADGIFVYDTDNTLQGAFFAGPTQDNATSTFAVVTNLDPATNIQNTAINLVNLIVQTNDFLVAYYSSSYGEEPGQMEFDALNLDSLGFYFTSTFGNAFNPPLPLTGDSVSAKNDHNQNYLYVSTVSEPESFPIQNFIPVGDPSKKILRIFGLRFGIFVLKEDGIFRIVGTDIENFTVYPHDTSIILTCQESAIILNNSIYAETNQGVVSISENGVSIKSSVIENTLLQISSEQYTSFTSASFGVSYETERTYIFFTVTNTYDTIPTQAFVYNWYTDQWTRWPIDRTCGLVNFANNLLMMGNPDNNYVYQERKNYNASDYADEQFAVHITSTVGQIINLTSTTVVEVGQAFVQGANSTTITAVNSPTQITVADLQSFTTGTAYVYNPIPSKLVFNPIYGDNVGENKSWQDIILYFQNAGFSEITGLASNNFSPGLEEFPIRASTTTTGWGNFSWGSVPWGGALGGNSVIHITAPTIASTGLWMNFGLADSTCFNSFGFSGASFIYTISSQRFR